MNDFTSTGITQTRHDVIVVGAGLAGLAAAIHLQNAGRDVVVLEATDAAGGRVRTDVVDGFLLDRGFQVLLTAYPEARRMFDYAALDLCAFAPASFIQTGAQRARIGDPFREPKQLLSTVRAPIGTLGDKARIAALRRNVRSASIDGLWDREETTTADRLRGLKFSADMIDRFFRPFFAGIQLDSTLSTSSRLFDFVFRMLSDGDNAVPAHGMGKLTQQLAHRLTAGTVHLKSRVVSLGDQSVVLRDGILLSAQNIIVATEGPAANKLLGKLAPVGSNRVTCVYFGSSTAPYLEPTITLNGDGAGGGPVNNFCVPSNVSPHYAPSGSHLLSASVVGDHGFTSDSELVGAVRKQLKGWFGSEVDRWDHLRTYDIAHAQPAQGQGVLSPSQRPVSLGDGVYVCGDHRDSATIHGALLSGRRAADAIITAPRTSGRGTS